MPRLALIVLGWDWITETLPRVPRQETPPWTTGERLISLLPVPTLISRETSVSQVFSKTSRLGLRIRETEVLLASLSIRLLNQLLERPREGRERPGCPLVFQSKTQFSP